MIGTINGFDFLNAEAERYWSFPAAYKGNKQDDIRNMIMSGQYSGAIKKDGAYERFIKDDDGNMMLISRTESVKGIPIDKINHVPHLKPFFDSLPKGTCLLGELYLPSKPGSRYVTTIMGCLEEKALQRQADGEKLHYYIFDMWAWGGKSFMQTKAETRFHGVTVAGKNMNVDYAEWAKYYEGQSLYDLMFQAREDGEEGIVITKKDSYPEPGKRTSRKTLKVKKEIENDIDCFLTGRFKESVREYTGDCLETWAYWWDIKNSKRVAGPYYDQYKSGGPYEPITKNYFNQWMSSAEIAVVDADGQIMVLGWVSNLTDVLKEQISQTPEAFKYKVVEISAMDFDPESNRFRHSKIHQWREDKSWQDCSYSQIK